MALTDTIFDASYALCKEFGPEGRIPRDQRLREKYPELSTAELQEIVRQVEAVAQTVGSLAERGGTRKIKKQEVIAELQGKHAFLQGEGLTMALFLVDYYAWHDGY
jgi:hypothetical protein